MGSPKKTVLIVDDDEIFVKTTKCLLEDNGYEVIYSLNSTEAIKIFQEQHFDVLLLDKNIPEISGMELLKSHIPPAINPVVIMVTANPSIISAVDAIKLGANNYLSKPFDELEILFKIKKELELKKLRYDNEQLHTVIEDKYNLSNFSKTCRKIMEIKNTVLQLRNSDVTILITGETGTGKGYLAKTIHFLSNRNNNSFVTINAGGIPEHILESELFGHLKGAFTGAHRDKTGLFKSADGGTVFIDEIGDMPYNMQVKLLRVLEDKEFEPLGSTKTIKVDIRIIAATNQNLEELVEKKKFRKDLYYRINVVSFELPSLKERTDDILPLANNFIQVYCKKNNIPLKNISKEVLQAFTAHSWPGNIRELENCIERMVLLGKEQTLNMNVLPSAISSGVKLFAKEIKNQTETLNTAVFKEKSLEDFEKEYFIQLMDKYKGRMGKVALILEINRKTLLRKIVKYGLDKQDYK